MQIIKEILSLLRGSYKTALKDGLKAGKGVTVMGGVNFGSEPYLVTLGDYVRISYDVAFITHDGGTWTFRDLTEYEDVIKYGKISVGSRTFIGCKSIIMPGVKIGERCVIGAGSIVTKDVPDGTVVCGVPARFVMTIEEYAQKCKSTMKPYDKEAYMADKKVYLQEYLSD